MRSMLFLILILGITMQAQQFTEEQISNAIAGVKKKYAPDKRVALFDVQFSITGKDLTLTGETNLKEAKAELLSSLKQFNISDEIKLLPSDELNGYVKGVVNLSVANIRSKPDHPAELITQALLGTPLEILKEGPDEWYLVQTPEGYIGWLDHSGFQSFTTDEMQKWMKSDKLIYTDIYGFVYSGEDQKGGTISDITGGGVLKLEGKGKNFFKVEFPDGRKGFVPKTAALPVKEWLMGLKQAPKDVENTAKKFLGVPYLWGGTSPKGMDCSGFTKTVYFLNGIVLARDASQQELYGEPVDISNGYGNLKTGDLLFFGPEPVEGKPQRITHVGIYLGDLKFIHAAGMVGINSFDPNSPIFSEYRTGMFISAKRILTSKNYPGILRLTPEFFTR